jgi:hypothetical protein
MSELDIKRYCNLMEEVKRRMNVIDFFISGGGHALFKPTTTESVSLQIRKILELIAMGSLVANKESYSKIYADFAKSWNAEYLMKDLERVNQNFYPRPIVEIPSKTKGVKTDLKERPVDYLTKNEFVKVYKKCGAIMHSGNPFGSHVDYKYYENNIPIWAQKIVNLLVCHQIQLVNSNIFYIIHMLEERDGKVHFYKFESLVNTNDKFRMSQTYPNQ